MHKICAALIKIRTAYADAADKSACLGIVKSIGKIFSTVLTVQFLLRGRGIILYVKL